MQRLRINSQRTKAEEYNKKKQATPVILQHVLKDDTKWALKIQN